MTEEIISELKSIKLLLSITNSVQLDSYLNKIITTENRRKIWIAIDGQHMQNEIAIEVGVSQKAVSKFLKILTESKLIDYKPYTPPTRNIDYVPASWFVQDSDD